MSVRSEDVLVRMGELLGVSWDNYRDSMTRNLRTLIRDEEFIDVSLHCEGRTLKARGEYFAKDLQEKYVFFRQKIAAKNEKFGNSGSVRNLCWLISTL